MRSWVRWCMLCVDVFDLLVAAHNFNADGTLLLLLVRGFGLGYDVYCFQKLGVKEVACASFLVVIRMVKDSSLVTYAINGLRSKFSKITRIIRHRPKFPTFDEVRSMILLEVSDMLHQSNGNLSFQNTSSSPTILVATNTSDINASSMQNMGIEQCCNFQ
ncbi:hypothetical protein Tco_0411486 [Tanacetum coccineum]